MHAQTHAQTHTHRDRLRRNGTRRESHTPLTHSHSACVPSAGSSRTPIAIVASSPVLHLSPLPPIAVCADVDLLIAREETQ